MDKAIHELTHVWQYRYYGDHYVSADLAKNPEDYDYGWVTGLEAATKAGKSFGDFNIEEQATIVDHYYQRIAYGSWVATPRRTSPSSRVPAGRRRAPPHRGAQAQANPVATGKWRF